MSVSRDFLAVDEQRFAEARRSSCRRLASCAARALGFRPTPASPRSSGPPRAAVVFDAVVDLRAACSRGWRSSSAASSSGSSVASWPGPRSSRSRGLRLRRWRCASGPAQRASPVGRSSLAVRCRPRSFARKPSVLASPGVDRRSCRTVAVGPARPNRSGRVAFVSGLRLRRTDRRLASADRAHRERQNGLA